ncbi:MAG: acyl--CoA ligase [Clostridia bacterium]|nr:acyl--CoA ligase [Clostridia bacterium]
MIITDLLVRNAKQWPNDTALVEINPEIGDRKRITWREYNLVETSNNNSNRREISWKVFDEKANKCANLLMKNGVVKGEKVGILLTNCLEWLPIYFGVLKTGALAVPLNFRYASDEILYCCDLADIEVLFMGPEFIGRVEEICDKLTKVKHIYYVGDACPTYAEDFLKLVEGYEITDPNIQLDEDDYGAIYFSSGTTGFPKAILHKHRALIHSARVEQNHHGQQKNDVFLCIPPLYHTGAKMHWFGSLYSGSKAVLLKGTKPDVILSAVSQEKCTIVWLLVPWAQDILDAIDRKEIDLSNYSLSQWRLMHIGAQPVPPSMIKRWKAIFPNQQYDTNYGLSESIGPGCVHLGVENIDHVGAIGVPGFGWECKILDENRKEVVKGEVGELAVKGPGVMICYYKDEKATKEVLTDDGWLLTGDMAMQDKDGFIYLVDRKKDVIITGGENLYPVQIEDFLRSHPAIYDVAVIGLPDKRLGEIATAIISVKEGMTLTEEEVNTFCTQLPRYKRPKKIIFADVPRNPTGKIEKPKLRKMYCGEGLIKTELNS